MSEKKLGRLEKVVLREVWGSDTAEFIVWLKRQENLAFLGNAIGRDLTLSTSPGTITSKAVDICCRDSQSDELILVKVQFDDSTDDQLGRLLVGATGSERVILLWIADHITDEHHLAINWLNENSNDNINIFGLEIDFWRIGDSSLAPIITAICKPKIGTKVTMPQLKTTATPTHADAFRSAQIEPSTIINPSMSPASSASTMSSAASVSDANEPQFGLSSGKSSPQFLEYWLAFNGNLLQRKSAIIGQKPNSSNWMSFPLGGVHFNLVATISTRDNFIAVGLLLTGIDVKTHFHLLQHSKVAIENEIGSSLEWQELPDKQESRILLRRYGMDTDDRSQWEEQHNWLTDKLEKFHKTFVLRVEALNVEEELGSFLSGGVKEDGSVSSLSSHKNV